MEPKEHDVKVNDYIIIADPTVYKTPKVFQLKKMSVEPYWTLQEVRKVEG